MNLLLNHDGLPWDEELLEWLFSAEERQLIKKIPRQWHNANDRIYWAFEWSAMFSVKSCYHLILNQSHISTPPSNFLSPIWNNIWGLYVPSRIHSFL